MFKRIRAYYSQEATSRRAVEREWRKQRELAGPFPAEIFAGRRFLLCFQPEVGAVSPLVMR